MGIKLRALPLAVASVLLCATWAAHAGQPVVLTDVQLDRAVAGALATATANGEANGFITQGGSSTFTTVTGGFPNDPSQGSAAVAAGAVGVVGNNPLSPGTGTSSGSVTTKASAAGNLTYTNEFNATNTVNGQTIALGFSYATGGIIAGAGYISLSDASPPAFH